MSFRFPARAAIVDAIGRMTPEFLRALQALGGIDKHATATLTSSAGVVTLDCAAVEDVYTLTLTENVTGWTFSNLPASTECRDIFVQIVQHASSAKTVASPATAGRTAGAAWTASATLSSRQTLMLRVFGSGTVELYPYAVMA